MFPIEKLFNKQFPFVNRGNFVSKLLLLKKREKYLLVQFPRVINRIYLPYLSETKGRTEKKFQMFFNFIYIIYELRDQATLRRSTKYAKYIFILRFLTFFFHSIFLFLINQSSDHLHTANSHRELSALSIKCTQYKFFILLWVAALLQFILYFWSEQGTNSFKINTEHSWIASRKKFILFILEFSTRLLLLLARMIN